MALRTDAHSNSVDGTTATAEGQLHWPPKDGATAPGADEGQWVDVPLSEAQRKWAVEQLLDQQKKPSAIARELEEDEGQWVDVPLNEAQKRWASSQERRAVPADRPSPRTERPSPPIEEPAMAARQPSPVTGGPPSVEDLQRIRDILSASARRRDTAPQMLRSAEPQPPASVPPMLHSSGRPVGPPLPSPQLQELPEWAQGPLPSRAREYGSMGVSEAAGGPELMGQAGTMIKDLTIGRPEDLFTGETGFETAMGGLDVALLPFMVAPGVRSGIRGGARKLGRKMGFGRGTGEPSKEAAERLAESASETMARLERGEAAPVIGALERFRPLHAARQGAYKIGERVGGPVVKQIERGLDKLVEVAEPLIDLPARGLLSAARSGRPWRGAQAELGTGKYRRTREQQDIMRAYRGEKLAAEHDISALGARLIRLLPDEKSQILARKISENSATLDEFYEAMENPNIQEAAELVREEFMKLGEEFIRGGIGPTSALGREGREGLIKYLRGDMSLDDLSRKLSEDYGVSQDLIEKVTKTGIAGHFGTYSPRLYETMEFTDKQIKELGSYIQPTHKVSPKVFEAALTTNRLKKRGDLPKKVREALGEIESIIYPTMKGVQQEKRVIANNRMLQSIFDTPSLVHKGTGTPPTSFQKLPDSKLLGPLSGLYVNPAVHRDLVQLTEVPLEGAKWLRRANAFIKKNLTIRNPATHIGNIETNWILADLGGMDFIDQFVWNMASMARYGREGPHWRKALEDGLFSSNYTKIDLDPEVLKGLHANPADIKIPKGVGKDSITGSFGVAQKMIDAVKYVDDKATALYRLEDDIPKFAMYNWLVDAKGFSSKDAVNRVHQVFPDYGDVAPIVERMRGSVMAPTFVTFQSKALPFMAASMIKHPLRAGKYTLLAQTVTAYSMASLLEEERLEEKAFLPEQMRPYQGPFGTEFGAYPRLPWRDASGRPQYADIRRNLVGAELGGGTGILGGPDIFDLGIIPSTAMQVATNQDLYQSRLRGEPVEITDLRVTEGVPHRTKMEKAQDILNFIGQQTLPSLTPGLGPWEGGRNWQRIKRSLEGTPDYTGEPQSIQSALGQALGGFRTIPIDPPQQKGFRALDIRGGLRDIEADLRSDARKYQTGQITREEYEDSKQRALDLSKRIMDRWRALRDKAKGKAP